MPKFRRRINALDFHGLGNRANATPRGLPPHDCKAKGQVDPCVNSPTGKGWVPCGYGDRFNTIERTPALINAFVRPEELDFWSLLGDNFYDRTGEISADVFSRISDEAKSAFLLTVPGNHDYWVSCCPEWTDNSDQCGNGYMQFYMQDTKASEAVKANDSTAPFDFSVDPDDRDFSAIGCKKPAVENHFWYNQLGNVGFVGQSGAYSLSESRELMLEACTWLPKQDGLEIAVLLGHWDMKDTGAKDHMDIPHWYLEMKDLPGCREFHDRGMLKYIVGHTHCNTPNAHEQENTGFRTAGWGMDDGSCGPSYGVPIFETRNGRIKFWYFDASSDDLYNSLIECVGTEGWQQCTHLATVWLDEPISVTGSSEQRLVA